MEPEAGAGVEAGLEEGVDSTGKYGMARRDVFHDFGATMSRESESVIHNGAQSVSCFKV